MRLLATFGSLRSLRVPRGKGIGDERIAAAPSMVFGDDGF